MTKHVNKTKIMIDGVDYSANVASISVCLDPVKPAIATVEWFIDHVEVDGTGQELTVHLQGKPSP